MAESKTKCLKCGAAILQSTAEQNGGRCKPCATGPKLENVAEGMEFGMRLFLGLVFAVVIGGVGYGIGSFLGAIGGIVLATPFALVGFVYGCLCVEINAIIRSLLPFMLDP
ncbi:MAG: hypothetical protein ABJZ55_12635 [Fuerstiella sp.]